MPIQFRKFTSLSEVNQQVHAYETQFGVTSEAFARDQAVRSAVPEFDAIEWNFLLMQRNAMVEDDACGSTVFLSGCKSKTAAVDTATMYENVAA